MQLAMPMSIIVKKSIREATYWIAFIAELEKTCLTERAFIPKKRMDLKVNKVTKEIGKALDIACPHWQ